MEEFARNLRHAWRSLAGRPGFAVVAVLTFALGIGANTCVFSMLNRLLKFQDLPYPDADRLVRVHRTSPQSQSWPHSPADFLDHRRQTNVFSALAAFTWTAYSLAEPGAPAERLKGMIVTCELFSALGVGAALGRTFQPEEDQPGRNQVVVLSHGCWLRRFNGDPAVVGRRLRLDGEPVEVIGVMPASMEHALLWGNVDVWRPLALTSEQRTNRHGHWLGAVGRLQPGVTLAAAQGRLNAHAARLAEAYPDSNAREGLRLVPFRQAMDDTPQRLSWFALGLTTFVLLIACANLASLQLVRVATRARETAIRRALGSGWGSILRQWLAESMLVSLAGGGLGLVLAGLGNEFFAHRFIIASQPGLDVHLDVRVLGFTLLCSLATGVGFGMLPAWLAARADVNAGLKENMRGGTASRSQHHLQRALIVGEIALALTLLAGAGLFIQGLRDVARSDPGWRIDGLLTAQLDLASSKYEEEGRRRAFHTLLLERLTALPGVEGVALSRSSPPVLGFNGSSNFAIEGQPQPAPGQAPLAYTEPVSPGYFETLGIRILEGRTFTASDTTNRPVTIINAAMARRFWPGESALGRRVGSPDPADRDWMEVVGVVDDVRFPASLEPPDTRFQQYLPLMQAPAPHLSVTLRCSGRPEAIATALRLAVAEIDPEISVYEMETVRQVVTRGLFNYALFSIFLGAFAVLGLGIAAVGIYGVVSYSVAQRTREIGTRMALGAQSGDVLWMVLGQGLRLSLLGALVGVFGAFIVARLLRFMVPGLTSNAPAVLAIVTPILMGFSLLACYGPARRACKLEPMTALRAE